MTVHIPDLLGAGVGVWEFNLIWTDFPANSINPNFWVMVIPTPHVVLFQRGGEKHHACDDVVELDSRWQCTIFENSVLFLQFF